MVGQTADVPNAGASGADWISTIASYTDPFNVNLSSTAGTNRYGLPNLLTVGTDDTAALNSLFSSGKPGGLYLDFAFPPAVNPFFM